MFVFFTSARFLMIHVDQFCIVYVQPTPLRIQICLNFYSISYGSLKNFLNELYCIHDKEVLFLERIAEILYKPVAVFTVHSAHILYTILYMT
jgi:hypothetical protein